MRIVVVHVVRIANSDSPPSEAIPSHQLDVTIAASEHRGAIAGKDIDTLVNTPATIATPCSECMFDGVIVPLIYRKAGACRAQAERSKKPGKTVDAIHGHRILK